MVRGPYHFRQRDLTAALKAAKAAGVPVKIEIDRDGKLTVTPVDRTATAGGDNEWDRDLGTPSAPPLRS
jgi:hypothetical protein